MIDPEILLQSKPAQIEQPLEAQAQIQGVQNLRNLGQLQQGQIAMQPGELQAQSLANQQSQLTMQRTQALNDAYRQAYTPPSQAGGAAPGPATSSVVRDPSGNQLPGAPSYNGSGGASASGGASTPGIDVGKLTSALAMGPAASQIPEILKGVNEFQKSTADLATANTKAATDQADYAGSVGATIHKAQDDPRLFLVLAQHALDSKAVDPKVVGPLMNQVVQALQQDPSGASATALTKQIADHFVAGSPAQQKLGTEAQAAQGGADRGTAALQTSNREASQQGFTNAISDLAARPPKDAAEYQQRVGALPYSTASRILAAVPVSSYDPQQSGPVLQNLGMTPDQRVTTSLRAQEIAKLNSPAELALKAAHGDPDAKAALQLLEQQSINERKASQQPPIILTPQAQTMLANNFTQTGTVPPLGRGPAAQVTAGVINQAAANNPTANIASNKATYAADKGSLAVLQKQRDSVGAFEQTALANLNLFLNAASKIPDSRVPWANTPLRLVTDKLAGSENMAAVNAARQVANNEIAKVTSNPTLSGTLSDSARHEVMAYNPENATFKQTQAVANILRQDMANRRTALDQGIAQIKGRIGGGGQPAAATPAAGGAVSVQAPNGRTYNFQSQADADNFKKSAGIQ